MHDSPSGSEPNHVSSGCLPSASSGILVVESPLEQVQNGVEASVGVVGKSSGKFNPSEVEHEEGIKSGDEGAADGSLDAGSLPFSLQEWSEHE